MKEVQTLKRIKSIYLIFLLFVIMILTSLAIIYRYSTGSLQDSLIRIAQLQIEHSNSLLNQKTREIEMEADWILNSNDVKRLQNIFESEYDPYNYVMGIIGVKEVFKSRQRTNVGMSSFHLYWPHSQRIVSTENITTIDKVLLEKAEDNSWLIYTGKVYFIKRYITDWDKTDDEPYLFIEMERDYLYRIKNMASGMEKGGSLLILSNGKSLYSTNSEEDALLLNIGHKKEDNFVHEVSSSHGRYQLLTTEISKNGLQLISYYPIDNMMKPIRDITRITTISLVIIMALGLIYMVLYYHDILLQLKILTGKLKQVEEGDLTTHIEELPKNEFYYVFQQFNQMTSKMGQLMSFIITEQKLRNQAELRQLQLQINPHFLYNSLSYIVTTADNQKAVTEMAVHLSNYYRYCTLNKSVTTVGEEISYAKAYLAIMAIRKRIEYIINVPTMLDKTPIIPLILQPIIENTIEHAIEKRENSKHIFIKGYQLLSGAIRFEISDDGDGLSEDDIEDLVRRLHNKHREDDDSVGLWNVNQRLINYYDESARLIFGRSIWGGLSVSFTIMPREMDDDSINR